MKKVLSAIWNYLKDWKNLLVHAVIGTGILLIAFFLPVKPLYRIPVLIVVIGLNILRMRLEKRRKARNAAADADAQAGVDARAGAENCEG